MLFSVARLQEAPWTFRAPIRRTLPVALVAGACYRLRLPWPDNVATWRWDGVRFWDDDTMLVAELHDGLLVAAGATIGHVADLEPA